MRDPHSCHCQEPNEQVGLNLVFCSGVQFNRVDWALGQSSLYLSIVIMKYYIVIILYQAHQSHCFDYIVMLVFPYIVLSFDKINQLIIYMSSGKGHVVVSTWRPESQLSWQRVTDQVWAPTSSQVFHSYTVSRLSVSWGSCEMTYSTGVFTSSIWLKETHGAAENIMSTWNKSSLSLFCLSWSYYTTGHWLHPHCLKTWCATQNITVDAVKDISVLCCGNTYWSQHAVSQPFVTFCLNWRK